MFFRTVRTVLAWIALFGCLSTTVTSAQTAADFYKSRTVTIIVGFAAGDGTDTWARLIAPRLADHLPGHPQVVVANVPGAGSLIAMNQIYNTLARDGTYIAAINRGLPFEPLLGSPGVQFDALKLTYLGSPDRDTAVCAVRAESGIGSVHDLKRREVVVGATGPGADTAMIPAILRKLLGLKFKVVTGYPGSRDVLLAAERHEVDGICVNYDSLAREPDFRTGKLRILLQAASANDDRLSDYPLARDLATTEEDRQAIDLFFQRASIGRPFVVGPNVPEARISALRQAFADSLSEPSLQVQAAAAGLNLRPVSGTEMTAIIKAVYLTPPAVVTRMREIFGRK